MERSLVIANNILRRAAQDNIEITALKLQKLLYFVHARFLHESKGEFLIPGRFEVEERGPALPEIYEYFRRFGDGSIKGYAVMDGEALVLKEVANPMFTVVLDRVWEKFKQLSGTELSDLTHREGTAWYKAKERDNPVLNDEDIRKEGESLFEQGCQT